ncbi:MAG: hypothetical protein PHT99_05565 [Methanoregula sp.]|nr:hypothetical protein [Methanoregula sp.]
MDKIIKITLGIFIVLLVIFTAFTGYFWYVESTYRASLTSTYSYTCTITTDSLLTNMTLFLPVPADRSGNSPVIGEFSAHRIQGIPYSWKTELYDTGKATLVKITIPALVPPTGTSPEKPFSVTLYTNIPSKNLIDTKNPVENSPMFRPVQDPASTECTTGGSGGRCSTYKTTLYADYRTDPDATVTIASSLVARNEWKIFEPHENEYTTDITALMSGDQNGWTTVNGYLEQGIGSYDAPTLRI